jgi:ParB family chromosome partitioning protein
MKKALGKGIKAFVPEDFAILREDKYAELDIGEIKPNPLQPRAKFEDKAIEELAQSIKESGILQPIVVIPDEGKFKILIGERRWRAAQRVGLSRIPALIRNIPREKEIEVSLVENLQREGLNPIEIAIALRRMTDELGYSQEEVADKVGKDRASVSNYLRLLKLPVDIQESLREEKIAMGHAKALLSAEDPALQIALNERIIRQGLSVREAESLVARSKKRSASPRKQNPDPNLEAVQEELLRALGTKVTISGSQKKGVVKIFYFSLDELNRIFELIKGVGG